MSLPACQQRVLDAMDKSLQATDPRLVSMFAIFTRLTNGEEPSYAERLPSGFRWWRSVRTVRTFVLIPAMAAIALSGVLLGVTTRGAQACGAVYAAGRAVAVRSVSCVGPLPGRHPAPNTQPARTRPVVRTHPAAKTGPAIRPAICARPQFELAWQRVCYR